MPRPATWFQMLWYVLLWCVAPAHAQSALVPGIDRAELLSWTDMPAALKLLDKLEPAMQNGDSLTQWLMVRGMAYDESGDAAQAGAVIARLHALGQANPAAEAVSHILQALWFRQAVQLDKARAELRLVGTTTSLPPYARFRLQMMTGTVLLYSGQHEAALTAYERALDVGRDMASTLRTIEAMIDISLFFSYTKDYDRAAAQLVPARAAAQQIGDEISLGQISELESQIADYRGDRAAARRTLLEAWDHAARSGSDKLKSAVLIDLGDDYRESADYAIAIGYLKQALVLTQKLHMTVAVPDVLFGLGMAEIGAGQVAQGKQHANDAIAQLTAGGNLTEADHYMRELVPVLERAGDLRGALDVSNRDNTVREQLMNAAREKAVLELSAKFNDERRAREIELLKRDNDIKSRDLLTQRLRQQMIVLAAALIALTCGALVWGFGRIRTVNARLLHDSRYDTLTGLLTRRYFNEQIFAQRGDWPYLGCLLLINVDGFERINEVFGHAAGDQVLSVIGRRLANALRDSDALVRWSSKEFLGLLGPLSEAQLNIAARRLLSAVRAEPVAWNEEEIRCTVSIGYASFPLKGAGIDIPLDRAITLVGKALYRAKQEGRDRACLITLVNLGAAEDAVAIETPLEEGAPSQRVHVVETVTVTA